MTSLFSDSDAERISAAIQAVEDRTAGEIIAVVAPESASYVSAPILWAALIALFVPWPFIHFTWWTMQWVQSVQILVFVVLATLGLVIRPLRFMLVPASVKRLRAHRRAVEQFLVQNLHTTATRTGVLVFVSLAERYAEIVADSGIHKKVPEATWKAIVDELTERIGDGRPADGFVAAIGAIGQQLAQHFPAEAHTKHVLPNHLIVLGGR